MSDKQPELKLYRGKWYITWYENNSRKRLSTGTPDKKTAFQALTDFVKNYNDKPTEFTVSHALERYINARKGKVMALSRIQEASIRIIEIIGDLRIDQINQNTWDYYSSKRFVRPGRIKGNKADIQIPVSSGTLRREFNVLKAALNLAVKENFLQKLPPLQPPSETAPRNRYLTKEEARKLLDACTTHHIKVFLSLAFYTGSRKGAILALTWDRVDFKNGMLDFQEPGRQLTAKRRAIVPIHENLLIILKEAYQYSTCNYVVEYNSRKVSSGIRWPFQKLCKKAELDWIPTPHHIKHSVASWMAMDGVPIDQAADWLATDPKTLRKVYRKFDPTYLRKFTKALDI
ncbi:tyrosine-type recombinase/integrase [Entomobacter blattae]|uniref:Phage integrase family protein n=1 Tax=Entomobacter blattae TaxID=2762277 RepID=A0A7H1NU13_9PROT|nr:site-specific integrase [Entomobacter blattae]QNT79273.1 Phage integrase family protein [Entomobacter blattae]